MGCQRSRNALLLSSVGEQHGNGPIHYACTIGETVIEIYPGTNHSALNPFKGGAVMLGFRVDDLDGVLAALEEINATVSLHPKFNSWRRRAVVQDPDGRKVELVER